MEFRILGPLEVVADGGGHVPVPAAKQRALLAILILNANQPVSSDRLIEELWGGRAPASARKVLQTYVSKLRRALGNDALLTQPAGYELQVEPDAFAEKQPVADIARGWPSDRGAGPSAPSPGTPQ